MTENMYGVKNDNGFYIRYENDTSENMKKTFNQCLFAIIGKSFVPDDWTNGIKGYEDDNTNYCICGHVIHNLFFIKHKPTGVQVQVGSECVKKIDKNLYKRITSDNFCLLCDDAIGKKLTIHKQGFCSDTCKKNNPIGTWTCYFNKHKGLTYNDIFKKDRQYFKILLDNVDTLHDSIKNWIIIKLYNTNT